MKNPKTLPPDFVSPDLRSVAELRAEIERLEAQNAHLKRLLQFRAGGGKPEGRPTMPTMH